MLDWIKIEGYDNKLSYIGNVKKGVNLPNIGETVLFCRPSYVNKKRDMYISGEIEEGKFGLDLYYSKGDSREIFDGLMWARFNKPYTENNTRYDLAYKDEKGYDFSKNHPKFVLILLKLKVKLLN